MTDEMNESYDMQHPGFGAILRHAWERSCGSISLMIVGVCTLLFVGVAVLDLLNLVSRSEAISFLGLSYVGLSQRFWLHQFLTAPVMHRGIAHLLFNMLALWMLGPGVEKALGLRRYIFFSILCAVCSVVGFLLFNWGTGNIVLGYSGVIFGILVAQAIFFPNNVIAIFAFFPLKMKHAVILLGAVELYLTVSPEGAGIAHAAHLFGAVAALIYLQGFRRHQARQAEKKAKPQRKPKRKPVRKRDMPREL